MVSNNERPIKRRFYDVVDYHYCICLLFVGGGKCINVFIGGIMDSEDIFGAIIGVAIIVGITVMVVVAIIFG